MVGVVQLRRSDEGPDLLGDDVQRELARWNRDRLAPRLPDVDWKACLRRDSEMLLLQGSFLECLREQVVREAADVPRDASGFIGWFEHLEEVGPGQHDALFDWLEQQA